MSGVTVVVAFHGEHMTYTRWDPFEVRYWGQIHRTDECWLWTGKKSAKGYGNYVSENGRKMRPHQWAWVLKHGEVPDGFVLDHLCRNRACVNPDHLEPVTAVENTRRGALARWVEPCPNGHDQTVYRRVSSAGKNYCSECRREAGRRHYEQNRDRINAKHRARYQDNAEALRARARERWANRRSERAS